MERQQYTKNLHDSALCVYIYRSKRKYFHYVDKKIRLQLIYVKADQEGDALIKGLNTFLPPEF